MNIPRAVDQSRYRALASKDGQKLDRWGETLRFVILGSLIGFFSLLLRTDVVADTQAMKHYGQGVHAFYQQRYQKAVRQFDLAAQHDERDPRIYFFRGLAKHRLGRSDEAKVDFRSGAQLEAVTSDRRVGWALQRVQGPDRLMVEQFRQAAKKSAEPDAHSSTRQSEPKSGADKTVDAPRQQPIAPRERRSQSDFRLSTLPEDETDPFAASDSGTLLGRGKIAPVSGTQPTDAQAAEASAEMEPFGSGVAAEAAEDDFVGEQFGGQAPGEAAAGDSASTEAEPSGTASKSKKRGILGAAIRAFSRSVPDVLPGSELADRIPGAEQIPGSGQVFPAGDAPSPGPNDAGNPAPARTESDASDEDLFGDDFNFDAPPESVEESGGNNAEPADDAPNDLGNPFTDDAFQN